MKYFAATRDQVLWQMSWANWQLLLSSIPEMSFGEEEAKPSVAEDQLAKFLKGI